MSDRQSLEIRCQVWNTELFFVDLQPQDLISGDLGQSLCPSITKPTLRKRVRIRLNPSSPQLVSAFHEQSFILRRRFVHTRTLVRTTKQTKPCDPNGIWPTLGPSPNAPPNHDCSPSAPACDQVKTHDGVPKNVPRDENLGRRVIQKKRADA